MNIDFSGQTALVTGATRGIGKQIADDLADRGAFVIMTGRDPEHMARLNADAQRYGQMRSYMAVDFSNADSTSRFLDELGRRDRIDICINNAGINRLNLIDETLLDDWHDTVAVNLEAPFLLTRCVSKVMKANKYGRIVNIASIFGVISKPKRSLYTISKFGLRGLTVSSALDLAPHNILVNTVSPGFVLTDLTKRNLSEQDMAQLSAQVPLGRFALPEEISPAVLFLASRHNTYITAQNIVVDGGFINV